MMGTLSRRFCLNFASDSSYSRIIDELRASTACSATVRALAGGSSVTTWRRNAGNAPPVGAGGDLTMIVISPWARRAPVTRSPGNQMEQHRHRGQGTHDQRRADQVADPAFFPPGAQ